MSTLHLYNVIPCFGQKAKRSRSPGIIKLRHKCAVSYERMVRRPSDLKYLHTGQRSKVMVTVSRANELHYAAFTPDTCSSDTCCIHLYPLSPSTLYPISATNCRHGYMYPLVSASRTLLRTCICRHIDADTSCLSGILVSGYMYLM